MSQTFKLPDKKRARAIDSIKNDQFDLDQEMNLDTLRAYLEWKLPNRERTEDTHYSKLLSELQKTGYSQFGKLNEALDRSMYAAEVSEKDNPPRGEIGPDEYIISPHKSLLIPVRYSDVGVVRVCLEILDPKFSKFMAKKSGTPVEKYESDFELKKYRTMIRERK